MNELSQLWLFITGQEASNSREGPFIRLAQKVLSAVGPTTPSGQTVLNHLKRSKAIRNGQTFGRI